MAQENRSSHPPGLPREDRVLTCVYCGQEYPVGTPVSKAKILTDHIAACEKHPLSVAVKALKKIRDLGGCKSAWGCGGCPQCLAADALKKMGLA